MKLYLVKHKVRLQCAKHGQFSDETNRNANHFISYVSYY